MAQQRAGLLEYYLALSQDLPLDVCMAGAKDYVLISGFPFQQEMRFDWITSRTPFKSVALPSKTTTSTPEPTSRSDDSIPPVASNTYAAPAEEDK